MRSAELAAAGDGHTVERESFYTFYICSSVRRNSSLKKSNKMQPYADIYLLLNYSTCFGRPSPASLRVINTLVAASGTDHSFGTDHTILEACSPYSMICTTGCNYSFMYS